MFLRFYALMLNQLQSKQRILLKNLFKLQFINSIYFKKSNVKLFNLKLAIKICKYMAECLYKTHYIPRMVHSDQDSTHPRDNMHHKMFEISFDWQMYHQANRHRYFQMKNLHQPFEKKLSFNQV